MTSFFEDCVKNILRQFCQGPPLLTEAVNKSYFTVAYNDDGQKLYTANLPFEQYLGTYPGRHRE